MPTAAFIAARKALLSELMAAHVHWRDEVINPAITKLNAATPADPALGAIANVLTPAVLKINLYRPELEKAIAATNAMVPDDPPVVIPPVVTPPSADWLARSTAPGVTLATDFSSDADVTPYLFANGATMPQRVEIMKRVTRHVDNGVPCLRIASVGSDALDYQQGQSWWRRFKSAAEWPNDSDGFGTQEFFIQFGVKIPASRLIPFAPGKGSWKFAIVCNRSLTNPWGAPNQSSHSFSHVLTNNPLRSVNFPIIYVHTDVAPNGTPFDTRLPGGIPGTDLDVSPGWDRGPQFTNPHERYCSYQKPELGCPVWPIDKWVWFQLRIHTRTFGGLAGNEFDLSWCPEGEKKWSLLQSQRDYPVSNRENQWPNGFSALCLTPYETNRNVPGGVDSYILYRHLIVSTKEPALPGVKPIESPPVIIPGTLPPWVPPPGTFADFTLNTPYEARPLLQLSNQFDVQRIGTAWSGGAMIRKQGEFGTFGMHGGGEHGVGASDSCGVLLTKIAERIFDFSNLAAIRHQASSGKVTDPDETNDFGEHADGIPGAPHTYNAISEGLDGGIGRFGNSAGGSTTLARAAQAIIDAATTPAEVERGRALLDAAGNAYNCVHLFDTTKRLGGTTRLTGSIRFGAPVDWGTNYMAACTDFKRRGYWIKAGTYGASRLIFVDEFGVIAETAYNGSALFPWMAHLDHNGQDVLLLWSINQDSFELYDLSQGGITPDMVTRVGGEKARRSPTISEAGMTPIRSYMTYVAPRWSTIMRRFIGLDYALATPTLLYVTPSDPDNLMGSSWAITREEIASFDGSGLNPANDRWSHNGVWGRLAECPQLRSLVWCKDEMSKGQLIRPAGMA